MAGTGSFSGNPVRVQTFGYDANARLTSERNYKGAQLAAFLGNPAAPATEATAYAYDNVGNRTAKTVTTAAGTESTSYSYDNNDRLTSETLITAAGSTVTTTYSWDGNGNLASKSSPGEYIGHTIYVFLDGVTGLPCVGQTTQGVDNRLQQHKEEGKRAVKQVLARFEMVAERTKLKDALRLAEQLVITELDGIDNLSNSINAISEKRGRLRNVFRGMCK